MPLGILETLQQSRTRDRHRHHPYQNVRVFGSLFVGLTAFLALLPFLFTFACQGILFIELTFPDINGIFHYRFIRSLLTSDDRHQPQVLQVAVTILNLHLVGISRSNRQHTTEHGHVHRHRHTCQRFFQTDWQSFDIDFYACLSSHRLGILNFI